MKIVVFANSIGGLFNFRRELLQALKNDGHDIIICLPDNDGRLDYPCIETPMQRRGMNPLKDMKLYSLYKKIIKAQKPDLVLTYTIKCNIYGGIAAAKYKVPYASNITGLGTAFNGGGIVKKLVTFLYKKALKNAKAVFFENAANRDFMVSLGITKSERCVVLKGAGVNLEEFAFQDLKETEPVNFLFMGRIMKEKGVDELFYAARRFREENLNARFTFIGGFEDDYKDEVERLCEQGIIEYKGFQADIKPFVADSTCVVLASYHEGMSNTLLESAAMGRPLIASDIPGCREAIASGVSGFTAKVKDSEDLYLKLKAFYNLPIEQKREMAKQSRYHVEKIFDRKLVIDETMKNIL